MRHDKHKTPKHVSQCLQLAILLEVSAHKPGNVNRTVGFQSTRYEHFLASAIAVEPSFARAAHRGLLVSEGKIEPKEIGIGKIVKKAISDIDAWQRGGNTLLGTVLLFSPIAAAAGMMMLNERQDAAIPKIRENVKLVVESTTPSDAVNVYEAINIAKPNGMVGKAPALDVNNPKSKRIILQKGISLYDIFKISAPYDSISKEWIENYALTFQVGLPYFIQQLEDIGDLNTAIIHAFLHVLSIVPDTLIARKVSLKKAKQVSETARKILSLGGLTTPQGKEKLAKFDRELRRIDNRFNPGTTADIIAAVLAIAILNGYRP
ncbi:MAG: triphosphoribosyl-dephospho-CoA synthase [Candidatus Bathyarchaeia archaeon]